MSGAQIQLAPFNNVNMPFGVPSPQDITGINFWFSGSDPVGTQAASAIVTALLDLSNNGSGVSMAPQGYSSGGMAVVSNADGQGNTGLLFDSNGGLAMSHAATLANAAYLGTVGAQFSFTVVFKMPSSTGLSATILECTTLESGRGWRVIAGNDGHITFQAAQNTFTGPVMCVSSTSTHAAGSIVIFSVTIDGTGNASGIKLYTSTGGVATEEAEIINNATITGNSGAGTSQNQVTSFGSTPLNTDGSNGGNPYPVQLSLNGLNNGGNNSNATFFELCGKAGIYTAPDLALVSSFFGTRHGV